MLFCAGSRAIFRADHVETDFYLSAYSQSGTFAELVEVVLLNPVLVDGVFDPQDQATGLVANWHNRRKPSVECVGGDDFF